MAFNPPQINNLVNRRTFRNPTTQIILYTVVIVLFSWFLLKPAVAQWSNQRATLKTENEKFAKIDSERVALNKLVTELDSKENDIKLLDEALPLNEEVTRLHIMLDNYVGASGMQVSQIGIDLSSIGVQAGDKAELRSRFGATRSIKTIPITLSVNGTVDQLRNMLELVENSGRVLDVERVELSKGQETTNFQLQLKAYAYDMESNESQ